MDNATRICALPDCVESVRRKKRDAIYCSPACAHRAATRKYRAANVQATRDKYRASHPHIPRPCAWRECDETVHRHHADTQYCSVKCSKRASAEREALRAPGAAADRSARWYLANTERALSRRRAVYYADPDAARAATRAWLLANPHKTQEHRALRRSRLRSFSRISFSAAQLAAKIEYWGGRCWMCRGPYEHLDHVKPISKGGPHMLANLRPACARCNSSKGAKWHGSQASHEMSNAPLR